MLGIRMSLELKRELDQLRSVIAEDTARVDKQVALVARLTSIGADPVFSETLLRNYQATKATRQGEMDDCEQEIAAAEARESLSEALVPGSQ
jgi:hypothetical protein